MRRVAPAVAILVAGLTGCGTVENFTTGWQGRTKPYGGVNLAAGHIKDDDPAFALPLTLPIHAADVGLSAIGDTLTLPVTLPIALVHAIQDSINNYYFPPDEPPSDGWRRFWFSDTPPAEPTPNPSAGAGSGC